MDPKGARETRAELVDRVRNEVEAAVETVSGVLEDAGARGGAAWGALRSDPAPGPVVVRRWPWALGAAVAGATAGVLAAYAATRLRTVDAPDAQEPDELVAVVDRVDGPPPAS